MDMLSMIAERKTLIAAAESDRIADDERDLIMSRIIAIENTVADMVPRHSAGDLSKGLHGC